MARKQLVTFNLVCLGWVFFRADSIGSAFEILGRLGAAGTTALVTPLVLLTIAGMLGVQYLPRDPAARLRERFGQLGPVLQGAAQPCRGIPRHVLDARRPGDRQTSGVTSAVVPAVPNRPKPRTRFPSSPRGRTPNRG